MYISFVFLNRLEENQRIDGHKKFWSYFAAKKQGAPSCVKNNESRLIF